MTTPIVVNRAPVPVDVLAAAEQCIRQAVSSSPSGKELPQISESQIRQLVDTWRINNPVPEGAVSLVDKSAALLTMIIKDLYEPFRAALASGVLQRPALEGAVVRLKVENSAPATSDHALFVLEEYQVTSFLGRYGVGRTLNTLSLLPGEETTIQVKTWRTTSITDVRTSSVVDSEEQEVVDQFASKVERETTSTTTLHESQAWYAKAEGSSSFGFGEVSASAGYNAEAQSSRESYARAATEQVRENARTARSMRKTELTHSSTATTTTGHEEAIDRVVRNLNLRRTLNFVFRELNQEYIARLHLSGVRFAHANIGQEGTWQEYSLAELPHLLDRWIAPEARAKVAAAMLGAVASVSDRTLMPVNPLEVVTPQPDGSVTVSPLKPVGGELDATLLPLPGTHCSVRWRPGPLAPAQGPAGVQDAADPHAVPGVLLSEQSIVMPTGAIVVDAVLGVHDALDEYAMRAQQAQLAASEAEAERESLLNDALKQLPADQRVEAYARATFPPADIENSSD